MREFVSRGTMTGKVATVRADGSPHVTPIWFVLDGDDLVFTTMFDTVKARNIERDPRVAISVDDQRPPYTYVRIFGTATLSDDLEQLRRVATLIGGRYMGPDRAEEFGERNAVPEERLVRVRIQRISGEAEMAA